MFTSIRSKFLLISSVFIIIPLIVIGISLSYILTNEVEDRIISNKNLILESLYKDVIDKKIHNMEATTLALSKNKDLHNIFKNNNIRTQILEQWEFCNDIFIDKISIHYGTKYNNIISSNIGELPENYKTNLRPWYQTGNSSNSVEWTPPYFELITNELTLSSTIGIKNNAGKYTGVISVNTTIQRLLESLQDKSKDINNEIIIVFENILPFTINDTIKNGSLSFNWGEIILSKKKSLIINDTEFYVKSVNIPRLHANLFILIDKNDIDKEVIKYMLIIIPILTAGLILTILAVFILSKSIIDRITSARLYLSELSKGNYDHRVHFASSGEFSVLNLSIDTLANTISSKINELENVNDELNKSLDKTNSLVNLRTSLIHLLSHNSASPITYLYNISYNLVKNEKDNNEYRMLHTASKNLKSLNENIMTYIKLDEGFESVTSELFDLQALTEIIMRNHTFRCDEKNITTSINSDKIYQVYNNYFMVKMILENLIDNAVKYSFKNSAILISIRSTDDFIIWEIEDGGPGFTAEDKGNIFGKFKTLSSKPTDGEGSVGLGLYIVKQVSTNIGVPVNLMEGTKETGKASGAKFSIKFKKICNHVLNQK